MNAPLDCHHEGTVLPDARFNSVFGESDERVVPAHCYVCGATFSDLTKRRFIGVEIFLAAPPERSIIG